MVFPCFGVLLFFILVQWLPVLSHGFRMDCDCFRMVFVSFLFPYSICIVFCCFRLVSCCLNCWLAFGPSCWPSAPYGKFRASILALGVALGEHGSNKKATCWSGIGFLLKFARVWDIKKTSTLRAASPALPKFLFADHCIAIRTRGL